MLTLILVAAAPAVHAETRVAGPADYSRIVRLLRAGDTLLLSPGNYTEGLKVHHLLGEPGATIVIRGAAGNRRSVFSARPGRNTVSIVDSAYVTIADLDLVASPQVDVDAVKAEGTARFAHHITIDGLLIRGFSATQQTVAISTKCPAWNWVIRRNLILGAGTGLYLGNSDGGAPFVNGLIERNTVVGTTGYAMQIKHQRERLPVAGLPESSATTVIRFNAFAKDEYSSTGSFARPNVLLGHWPLQGAGTSDRYVVYGNILLDNPHEVLLQAEGNVILYNNVFINRAGEGLAIRAHNDLPRAVDAFHNTVISQGIGWTMRDGDPRFAQKAAGNAIFAGSVVPGTLAETNFVRPIERKKEYLRAPQAALEDLDLAPFARALADPAFDLAGREGLPDVLFDFDGVRRIGPVAGAYAGGGNAQPARFRELAAVLRRLALARRARNNPG